MLARLLRKIFLFQMVCGALLGGYLAAPSTTQRTTMVSLMWALAGALLLPLLLQFSIVAVSMARSRAAGPLGPWWRASWGELKATLLVFMLRQPWPRQQPASFKPLPGTRLRVGPTALPVLLVHGYICNHRVWDDVALALRQAGHPVLALDLEPLFTSIDDYAPLIEIAVSNLLSESGADKVALVGHSMGGLAIRAWLRGPGALRIKQIASVITLGTPHQGTHIANSAMSTNAAQMVWHSPWLQLLAQSEDSAKRALMHIAITEQDNVVYPQCEQVLAGAQVKVFTGLGHLQLCLDTGVIDWVRQQLAASTCPPVTP